MPKVEPVNEGRLDAEFADKLTQWKRQVDLLPDGELRALRAKLLLENDQGNKARLSYRTISMGGAFESDLGTPRDLHSAANKTALESEAENLIALCMPIYEYKYRSPAMEALRQEIKHSFSEWLDQSAHAEWTYGTDHGQHVDAVQASFAVQKMCDDWMNVMKGPEYQLKLEEAQGAGASPAP